MTLAIGILVAVENPYDEFLRLDGLAWLATSFVMLAIFQFHIAYHRYPILRIEPED